LFAIDNFENAITYIRNDLPPVPGNSQETLKIAEGRPKRRRRLNYDNLNLSAKEIYDSTVFQIRDRFACKEHFYGVKLLQREYFNEYKRKLPLKDIEEFCSFLP
jgi:hypothetical protein